MSNDIIILPWPAVSAPQLFTPTAKAAKRVLEFFTAQVNNDHTRRAYLNATRRFAAWCETYGLHELAAVQPFHVAAFVKELQGTFAPPTVKQHLAALRILGLPYGVDIDTVSAQAGSVPGMPLANFTPTKYLLEIRSTIRALRQLIGQLPEMLLSGSPDA